GVGANIGLASLLFKQCFPEARIIAVEPAPETYLAQRENFARHIPDGVTHNLAVTGEDGVAHFGYYPKAPAESGFYTDQDGDSALAAEFLVRTGFPEPEAERFAKDRHRLTTVECRTVTLSTLMAQAGIDHIDLLKIDVE
ncbi:FkbM family methyltransferase, partial [Saccharothrix sp. MB29]|nr:FkbM family methyltransferase [Saccharothrix sp. MB29]